jgi:glycerol kinase
VPEIESRLVVAVDQGTSSTKIIVVDADGTRVNSVTISLGQTHPHAGWVQQDADEIADSVRSGLARAIAGFEHRIAGIGISSQRESAVVWHPATGAALGPVLGWQDRRTIAAAEELTAQGHGPLVRDRTGLPLDPMFSALKFAWLLDQVDPDRSRSAAGEIALGTVDSWLLFVLTGEHRIEAGNASRTQLLNLDAVDWDEDLLALFRVPRTALPRVVSSTLPSAPVIGIAGLPPEVRVHAVLGDSHAALFGHGVRAPGAVKVTFGTGSSIMGLVDEGAPVDTGLVRTIAWQLQNDPAVAGAPAYAFEGNILSTGATVMWLSQFLGCDPNDIDRLAQSVGDSNGVDLVPAFSGLGAPWWDPQAEAAITGLGLGTTQAHVARAAFDSIPLQVTDVLDAAERAARTPIATVMVDGGSSRNDWLMQQQANLSGRTILRSPIAELSAMGVAHLAGLGCGVWTAHTLAALQTEGTRFEPGVPASEAQSRRDRWARAVTRSRFTPAGSDTLAPPNAAPPHPLATASSVA